MISRVVLIICSLTYFAHGGLKEDIVGTWQSLDQKTNRQVTMSFGIQGVFSGVMTQNEKVLWKFSGKWSITKNVLTYEYIQSDPGLVKPGSIDHDEIISLNEKKLAIKSQDSVVRDYKRVLIPHQ